jgi:hypothetical protein
MEWRGYLGPFAAPLLLLALKRQEEGRPRSPKEERIRLEE